MAVLKNRAKMSTSTTGTGTITLGSAEDGYQSFADAGVANADVVRYVIEDGNNFEIGTGTYTSSGTTLSRTVSESSNSDAAINLSGSATVFIGATAEDIPALYADNTTLSAIAPIATGSDSVSLGSDANSSGTDSIAIMNCNASGLNSLAAVIANNTTTYGAQGNGSISIGTLSKATAIAGTAIGYGATSTHAAASAFGTSATTTASNQIALGGSGITARISGAYNLPTSDGTNGQVLTTNGSGAVTFADAAGGDPDLYRDNASGATTPSATGTNAVAIGSSSSANSSAAIALGDSAKALGSDTLVLQKGRASGSQATSIAVHNNSSAYGSNHLGAVSIGSHAKSTQDYSFALGHYSQANANYAMAFGRLANAGHISSVAIGHNAATTSANQIALGSTSDTVKISGTYTLPTSDGTANQVLTTNGSGAVTFADAGGGNPDLYSDSANGSAVTPTSNAGGSYNSVAIGNGADIGSGRGDSIAIGTDALTNQSQALAIGRSATVNSSGTWGTAVGRNSVVNGQAAVALGNSYGSGSYGFSAVIDNNSIYGASSSYAVAIGKNASASGSYSVAIGSSHPIAGSFGAISLGYDTVSNGTYATVLGNRSTATAQSSVALGTYAKSDIQGKLAYSSERFGLTGDSQAGLFVLRCDTTTGDPEKLQTTAGSQSVGSTNQVVLPNDSVFGFTGTVIARENSSQTDDFAVWEIKGGAVRGANAASTTLGSYNINKISESTGAANWSIALSADTTNGAVAITVTGEASHSIRWVATVNTTEVTY